MNTLKKLPKLQLEKFSTIFTQLGLVLVLFIVFIALEYESEVKTIAINDTETLTVFDITEITPVYEKEVIKKHVPKKSNIPITTIIDDPQIVDDTDEEINIVDDPKKEVKVDINTVIFEEPEEEEIDENDEPVGVNFVRKVPIFKGCENLSEAKARKCLDKKMSKLVRRHFNTDLASDLGLKSGKHKITTQFVIDKEGRVTDVQISKVHNKLQKEAKRIIDKIPEFTPGENNGQKVKVRYTLPINFMVE